MNTDEFRQQLKYEVWNLLSAVFDELDNDGYDEYGNHIADVNKIVNLIADRFDQIEKVLLGAYLFCCPKCHKIWHSEDNYGNVCLDCRESLI